MLRVSLKFFGLWVCINLSWMRYGNAASSCQSSVFRGVSISDQGQITAVDSNRLKTISSTAAELVIQTKSLNSDLSAAQYTNRIHIRDGKVSASDGALEAFSYISEITTTLFGYRDDQCFAENVIDRSRMILANAELCRGLRTISTGPNARTQQGSEMVAALIDRLIPEKKNGVRARLVEHQGDLKVVHPLIEADFWLLNCARFPGIREAMDDESLWPSATSRSAQCSPGAALNGTAGVPENCLPKNLTPTDQKNRYPAHKASPQ